MIFAQKKIGSQILQNMTFDNYKFIAGRDLPRVLIVIFVASLFYISFQTELNVEKYTGVFLVGITAVYAYLTYELLRITKHNKISPYIKIDFLVISNLNSSFFQKYEKHVNKTPEYITLKQNEGVENSEARNIIFIKAENTGESLAIGAEVILKYKSKNFVKESSIPEHKITFQDLKPGESSIQILEIYEHATLKDYYEIEGASIGMRDIGSHYSGENPKQRDIIQNIAQEREPEAVVLFKIKK